MNIRGVDLAVHATPPRPTMVWGHGLLSSVASEDGAGLFDWSTASTSVRIVRYDARGHGRSGASLDEDEYRWDRLALDMLAVADAVDAPRFVAGGASMGAATSLHAAILAPDRIVALVLVIPPTAWASRPLQARQYRLGARTIAAVGLGPFVAAARIAPPPLVLLGQDDLRAARLRSLEQLDRNVVPHVLRGAAHSDLPPLDAVAEIDAPALVLAWAGDPAHPTSTATTLAETLPEAQLTVARSFKEVQRWPALVADFLGRVAPRLEAD